MIVSSYSQIDNVNKRLLPAASQIVVNTFRLTYHLSWSEQEGNYKHPPKNIRGNITGKLYHSIKIDEKNTDLYSDFAIISSEGISKKGFNYGRVHEYGGTKYKFPEVSFMRKTADKAKPLIVDYIKKEITSWLS